MKKKKIKVEELPVKFSGGGETMGYHFRQVIKTPTAYMYEVTGTKNPHFEVFERRAAWKVITFNPYELSSTEQKESYPKKGAFGIWAWTILDLETAMDKVKELETKIAKRIARKEAKDESDS